MAIGSSRAPALAATAALGLVTLACSDNGRQGTASDRFDDDQLKAFVIAEAEVRDIEEDYSSRLESAGADEDPAALQSRAQVEIQGAIEDAGLSIREYSEIAQAVERDPGLEQALRELTE